MNRYIEKAYKAWRATLHGNDVTATRIIVRLIKPLNGDARRVTRRAQAALQRGDELLRQFGDAKPRKYAGTGRYTRTAAHKEASRKAALRRWAKARRRA